MALIDEPLLRSATLGDRLQLAAGGSWTAPNAADLEPLIDDAVARGRQLGRVELNMAGVENLDTFGAWLLERLLRDCAEAGRGISVTGLPDRFRGIINEAHQSNRASAEQPHEGVVGSAVAGTKRALATISQDVVLNVAMFGALVVAAVRVLVRPGSLRLTSVVHHLDRVCWRAVPIVLLITVLIGAIIAQQGIFHFRRFGAEVYVVDMLGILVMREIGVLIVAIMIAGRSGSAYTAELGAMKMREEIDALHTMGLDPIDVLVLPRVLALVIAMPILTFLGSMAALYGGGMVCWLYAGMKSGHLPRAVARDHLHRSLRGRHEQGAVHGAGDRHRGQRRRAAGEGQRRVARPANDGLGGQIDLPGDRARRDLRHVLCRDREVADAGAHQK